MCTLLYVGVAIVLTGVVPYQELDVAEPIALGIDRIVELRGWDPGARKLFTATIKFGAIAGLTSVILVMILGQTRVFYAIARDGLLPWFGKTHPKYHTPHVGTAVTGVFIAICAGVMPIHIVGELVSIGTLLAFVVVCIGVPILRRTEPDHPRSFAVRFPNAIGARRRGCVSVGDDRPALGHVVAPPDLAADRVHHLLHVRSQAQQARREVIL